MTSLRVAVLGATGYTGGEALRLLAGHPAAEVTVVGAGRTAGGRVGDTHPHLVPFADRRFESLPVEAVAERAEAALLALPHEESAGTAPALVEAGVRVVDLSGAFRLEASAYPPWYGFEHPDPTWLGKAVYGLPEVMGEQIAGADLVANPGCYPTAVLLALGPLLSAGLLEPEGMVVDAKSGISGAGRVPAETTQYAASEGSIRPYQAGVHRHTPEIEAGLSAAAGAPVTVTFVPHVVPTTRGILATCYARTRAAADTLAAALAEAHDPHPFVRALPAGELPDPKRVAGSNLAEVGVAVDGHSGTAVVAGAVDNLVKGAAGQAIQNLNLMFGLPETAGLDHPPVYP